VDPGRKRKLRLVVALGAATLLASALIYTSLGASSQAKTPSQVLGSAEGESYKLTGEVEDGSIERTNDGLRFEIRDREGSASVPVDYSGLVPDPFRDGREVIVTGEMASGTFVADRDSLVTKCPSKFRNAEEASS
jgi:cytochrome c-type biogenesis protein CcmE